MVNKPHDHSPFGIALQRGIRRAMPCWVLCAALLLSGCSKEPRPEGDEGDGTVRLQFSTTIGSPSSKGVLSGTNFPVSAAGTVSNIGLFMMQSNGTTPYTTGSDNLIAELTGKSGPAYTCRYQYKDSSTWMDEMGFYVGQTITLWGYYPYHAAATPSAIPFDLTAVEEQANQSDVLWSAKQTLSATAANYTQKVALNFQHAYTLIEFLVKKKDVEAATVTKIEVMNKSGKSWIVGKGNIDPRTGAFSGTTAATVAITCNSALATDSYTTFQVMLPPFSGAFADGDVEVQFYIGGSAKPQKFLVLQSYLSGSGSTLGMSAGLKYAYKLVYRAVGDGGITVLPWDEDGANGNIGDDAPMGSVSISPWDDVTTSDDIGDPPPPAVGDYYYSDGSYSTALKMGKTATGLVYYLDPANPQKYKVMSLEEPPAVLKWAASKSYVVSGARSDTDGKANLVAIKAAYDAKMAGVSITESTFDAAFPAAAYCYNYTGRAGTDAVGSWYLPAKSELQYLWCSYNGVAPISWASGDNASAPADAAKQTEWNDRIKAGGVTAEIAIGTFRSSTEHSSATSNVWYVTFSNGYTTYGDKSNDRTARCIRDI